MLEEKKIQKINLEKQTLNYFIKQNLKKFKKIMNFEYFIREDERNVYLDIIFYLSTKKNAAYTTSFYKYIWKAQKMRILEQIKKLFFTVISDTLFGEDE